MCWRASPYAAASRSCCCCSWPSTSSFPTLSDAGKALGLLGRIEPGWLVVAVALQAASLLCYSLLTRTLVIGSRPGVPTFTRITLATSALSHVIPAGAAGGTGLGYQLLTANGVAGPDAGFALAGGSIGSAVVLNLMLFVALVVAIPLAGVHPLFVLVLLVGLLALLGAFALVYLFTRGEESAVRVVRRVGRRIPRVGADRFEEVVRQVGDSVTRLIADRRLRRRALTWAALNWLLDAASLWTVIAAFGHYLEPAELFTAYGIAYVLAVIPITPAGLGVVEVTATALLVSFGLPRSVAALGVLGWRLVNFWLPIPLGGLAYLSLTLPRRQLAGRWQALRPSRLRVRVRPRSAPPHRRSH